MENGGEGSPKDWTNQAVRDAHTEKMQQAYEKAREAAGGQDEDLPSLRDTPSTPNIFPKEEEKQGILSRVFRRDTGRVSEKQNLEDSQQEEEEIQRIMREDRLDRERAEMRYAQQNQRQTDGLPQVNERATREDRLRAERIAEWDRRENKRMDAIIASLSKRYKISDVQAQKLRAQRLDENDAEAWASMASRRTKDQQSSTPPETSSPRQEKEDQTVRGEEDPWTKMQYAYRAARVGEKYGLTQEEADEIRRLGLSQNDAEAYASMKQNEKRFQKEDEAKRESLLRYSDVILGKIAEITKNSDPAALFEKEENGQQVIDRHFPDRWSITSFTDKFDLSWKMKVNFADNALREDKKLIQVKTGQMAGQTEKAEREVLLYPDKNTETITQYVQTESGQWYKANLIKRKDDWEISPYESATVGEVMDLGTIVTKLSPEVKIQVKKDDRKMVPAA
jgi:hypothetical protein